MNLRDALLRDFKVDLPLGGGSGSRADPILILSDDMNEVSRTAEVTVSLLQKGKGYAEGSDIFWRVLARENHDEAGEVLFRLIFERLVLALTELAHEKVSFFFSTPRIQLCTTPAPYVVHIDSRLSVAFPFKMAGLDYSTFRDFEREQPGLGYCVGYSGPKVEATLYVYTAVTTLPTEVVVRRELETTLQHLHGSHHSLRPFSNPVFGPHALGVELNLGEHRRGLVMIDGVGSALFKWRITWLNDERRAVVEDFISHSRQLLPREDRKHHTH